MSIEECGVRVIDTLNFIPMPLATMPKTFGEKELSNGYFPHFFNKAANSDYVGPLPEPATYGADAMKEGELLNLSILLLFIFMYLKRIALLFSSGTLMKPPKALFLTCVGKLNLFSSLNCVFTKLLLLTLLTCSRTRPSSLRHSPPPKLASSSTATWINFKSARCTWTPVSIFSLI